MTNNKRGAGKAGIARLLAIEHLCSGVPEPGRCLVRMPSAELKSLLDEIHEPPEFVGLGGKVIGPTSRGLFGATPLHVARFEVMFTSSVCCSTRALKSTHAASAATRHSRGGWPGAHRGREVTPEQGCR